MEEAIYTTGRARNFYSAMYTTEVRVRDRGLGIGLRVSRAYSQIELRARGVVYIAFA